MKTTSLVWLWLLVAAPASAHSGHRASTLDSLPALWHWLLAHHLLLLPIGLLMLYWLASRAGRNSAK